MLTKTIPNNPRASFPVIAPRINVPNAIKIKAGAHPSMVAILPICYEGPPQAIA